ncbi:MAG: N-acetylmuramoyl-L-alanine amidase [Oscillospiraceae bacterium]|nr:N-acetylmuramoyl-L-alanine amidase [Oscillospiraceae bacterium]
MKKSLLLKFALLLTAIAIIATLIIRHRPAEESTPAAREICLGLTLIIDPGHGGADGGAVSANGLRESEVNLDIAQRLDQLMGFFGVRTVMTRDSEDITYSPSADTIRAKKVEDTRNRVSLINSIENAVLISIHQNTYPSPGPSGTQVLFARTAGSEAFAKSMQQLFITAMGSQNRRTATRVPGNVFLMNQVTVPAILVECAFLSNPEEEALLKTGEYRLKIAAIISAGFLSQRELFAEN